MIDYAQCLDFLARRRSVRQYEQRPVPSDVLEKLVTAAIQAPSASSRQDWEFIVICSRGRIAELAEVTARCWKEILETCESDIVRDELARYASNFDWFAMAPALIAVTCKRPEGFLQALLGDAASAVAGACASAAMATQNLLLAAETLGLGACCLTGPVAAAEHLKPLLGMGRNRQLVCLVAVGYPVGVPDAMPRKGVQDVMKVVT